EYQGNYRLVFESGVFTIKKRPVVLRWSKDDFTYDGNIKTISAKVVNAVTREAEESEQNHGLMAQAEELDEVYVEDYANNAKTDAGEYVAEALTLGGKDADNYTLKDAKHPWRIRKAAAVISAEDETVIYDGNVHRLTGVLEQGVGTVSSRGNGKTNAGVYTVVFTVPETKNYTSAELPATLRILPKSAEDPADPMTEIPDMEISSPEDETYNSTSFTPVLTVADRVMNNGKQLVRGRDYELYYRNNVDAGTAEVIVGFMGNYTGNVAKTFEIRPAPVTLKVKDASSRIGEPLVTPSYRIVSGRMYGNDLPGELVYRTGKMTVPGKYPITAKLADGVGNTNYKITIRPGVYTL
ncbi:MAG: hypothetical protein HUJ73_00640, partial [Eubacterium sp.]|nr:hypothetical protein [Eubacterium sp.]